MSDYISREDALNGRIWVQTSNGVEISHLQAVPVGYIANLPPEDVQPVTFCKDCQWLADIKDVETGELYHTCGVLAFDVPDGFACNQGKRKGADE